MFIVLRSKTIRRTLLVGTLLLTTGISIIKPPVTQAAQIPNMNNVLVFSQDPQFTKNEEDALGIQKAGFIYGMGKTMAYYIKEKQKWEAELRKAYFEVEKAKLNGKTPREKYKAMVAADQAKKNPPKKSLGEKLFGNTWTMLFGKDTSTKFVVGGGLTTAGLLMLLKVLALAL